jgi:spore germination protein GerM
MKKNSLLLILLLVLALGLVVYSSCKPTPVPNSELDLKNPAKAAEREVTIYFSKSRGSDIVTEGVTRDLPEKFYGEPVEFAVEQLLRGPTSMEANKGFFSEIPKGTKLLGVKEKGNGLRINLSEQFSAGGGSSSMQQRVAELSKTVQAAEKDKPVYLDVNGQELQVLGGEGIEVKEPINKPVKAAQ